MFLKIFLRSTARQFSFFLIKVIGLSLALTLGILVFFFTKSELGFDRFHKDANRIYRVSTYIGFRGGMISEGTPFLLAQSLVENIPEIEQSSHFISLGKMELGNGSQTQSSEVHLVDNHFLDMFNFSVKNGDGKTALEDPNSVIISEKLALQLFGNEEPLFQQLTIHLSNDEKKAFKVGAIMENIPENSSIVFDILISDKNAALFMGDVNVKSWIPFKTNVVTFFKAKENSKASQLVAGLNQISESHGIPERLNSISQKEKFPLMKLTDVHFQNDADVSFLKEKGDLNYLYVLVSVSILILLVAAMNFTNLSLSLSIIRSKEIGIRKVLGSTKLKLRKQFMLESALTTVISLVIGILTAYLSLPYFNELLNKNLTFNFLKEPSSILLILLISAVTALLAGAYPACSIASQRTIASLQGKVTIKHKWLPKSLTIFQFGISMLLIIIALNMQSQLSYITNYDLGFDKEQLIYQTFDYSKSPSDTEVKRFTDEAMKYPRVLGISGTRGGLMDNEAETLWSVERNGETLSIPSIKVGYGFIPMMGIQLMDGRNFIESSPSDVDGIIVNQAFVDLLEIKEPVGNTVDLGNQRPIILGVVNNFRFNSLRTPVRPLILNLRPSSANTAILIRIGGQEPTQTLEHLKMAWEMAEMKNSFDYHFFKDDLESQYESELNFKSVIGYASFFAITTALIGLIGLTSLSITKRLKEISLRRVVGAGILDVLSLFMKDTGKLVFISIILFWPLCYIYLEAWLQNFNVRTTQNPLSYLGVGLLVILIAAILILFQVRKITFENPANVLRSE